MTQFDVFEHAAKGYEAVKRGFSWPAFFFALPWAFLKRLWLQAVLVLSAMLLLPVIPGFKEFEHRVFGSSGLALILGLLFGFRGNGWRRQRLEALGWRHAATIEADNPSLAIADASARASARRH